MTSEYRRALAIVWLILTVGSSSLVALAIVADPSAITPLIPVCEWKERYARECSLCGMTTSFFLIGDGEFTAAMDANRASVPLFAAFCLNGVVAIGHACRRGLMAERKER